MESTVDNYEERIKHYIYIYILIGYDKVRSSGFIFGICSIKFRHPNDDWVLVLDQNTT